MNLDWVVAVSAFLIFIGLGFGYYWTLFETNANPVQASLEPVNQKVLGFLKVDSWSTPIKYDSPAQASETDIIYFDFSWPEGTKNSTHILDSGLPLSCMLQGSRVYFQASVQPGNNDFQMAFSNDSADSPVFCNSGLDTANANLSIPWVSEKSVAISQSRIGQMLSTDYTQFRESLGIARNFQVRVDQNAYGPSPPQYTNTYVRENHYLIQETGQPVDISVMVW
jgi:hypothetical protein